MERLFSQDWVAPERKALSRRFDTAWTNLSHSVHQIEAHPRALGRSGMRAY